MPIKKWYLKDIEQEETAEGFIIKVITNVPCHLFMRWSNETWRLHLRQGIIRGLTKLFIPYYCFVVYHDNEQEEPGDTLIHTFTKEPWPFCETRYFYFWGQVVGEDSPSNSPCFIKHRLHIGWSLVLLEPWTVTFEPPDFELVILEPWTVTAEPPIPPPQPWPFYEPWGNTLTENNPWESNLPLGGIDYELYDSLIRLYNPSMDGCGIKVDFTPAELPLLDEDSLHLIFQARSTEPAPTTHDAYIPFQIPTTNGTDTYMVELVVTRGDVWGPWGSLLQSTAYGVIKDYGLDPGPIDFTTLWKWGRKNAGLSDDPTGWYLQKVSLIFESVEYEPEPYVINDELGFYYSSFQCVIIEPWTATTQPPKFEEVITEPWTSPEEFPEFEEIILEEWTS